MSQFNPFAGLGDMSNLMGMMKQAQNMQDQMQSGLKDKSVVGSSGGGMVKVTLNGLYEPTSVSIDPKVVDPSDVSMLEDLVRAALSDAVARIEEMRGQQAQNMLAGLGLPPGMF